MITDDNLDSTKFYRTSDLGCSAALVSVGFNLTTLDRTNPSRALFVFVVSAELQASIAAYWEGQLKVDAKGYFESLRWLKSRLYNG